MASFVGCLAAPAVAADEARSGFQLTGDFAFALDGDVVSDAEIYFSQRATAYLVMASSLDSPLLISPRAGTVESLNLMKVARRENGVIDLLPNSTLASLGSFRLLDHEVLFQVEGRSAKLIPKPALLGDQPPSALVEHKPEYGRKAAEYSPIAADVAALASYGDDAEVTVYFGTWCSACGRLVPRILRVAEEIEGSKIRFEYYGLPRPLSDDPLSAQLKITGVPTAIIRVGGKEVGRLIGGDLNQPEAAMKRLLGSG